MKHLVSFFQTSPGASRHETREERVCHTPRGIPSVYVVSQKGRLWRFSCSTAQICSWRPICAIATIREYREASVSAACCSIRGVRSRSSSLALVFGFGHKGSKKRYTSPPWKVVLTVLTVLTESGLSRRFWESALVSGFTALIGLFSGVLSTPSTVSTLILRGVGVTR